MSPKCPKVPATLKPVSTEPRSLVRSPLSPYYTICNIICQYGRCDLLHCGDIDSLDHSAHLNISSSKLTSKPVIDKDCVVYIGKHFIPNRMTRHHDRTDGFPDLYEASKNAFRDRGQIQHCCRYKLYRNRFIYLH